LVPGSKHFKILAYLPNDLKLIEQFLLSWSFYSNFIFGVTKIS